MALNTPAPRWLRYVRHLIVDAGGRGDFLTPGAAMTYLNGVTRDASTYWQVEVRPAEYWSESQIAIPSYTQVFCPFPLGPGRSWEPGSVAHFRHPGGNLAAPFITLAAHSKLDSIVADLYINVTPTGTCSVVQTSGSTCTIDNCRITQWCSAGAQIVSCADVLSSSVLYAAGTVFAIQGATRTNARSIWAKGGLSLTHCRIHDDDVAGGIGIYFDTAVESTISFTRFGTHPKSQFTNDVFMNANGMLWLLNSKWWTTGGAFAANAKVQEDEV
jgi:hypothetical protein